MLLSREKNSAWKIIRNQQIPYCGVSMTDTLLDFSLNILHKSGGFFII